MKFETMRENYFWHKLHSLTGIIPVGYYLVQHLSLNTFSLAGAEKFNAIIGFFEGMPVHFRISLKAVTIWLPLLFHAVYGIFIISRAEPNYSNPAYRFRENRYYTFQRLTGIVAFFFIIYHFATTSLLGMIDSPDRVLYATWNERLSDYGYGVLVWYMIGVAACSYHFAWGIWSFCIRWGITVGDSAQKKLETFAQYASIVVTLIGWMALYGFFNPVLKAKAQVEQHTVKVGSIQVTSHR